MQYGEKERVMSDLIDRRALRSDMYHEAFEKDSDEQRWDSGCWIRYKMFERVVDRQPSEQSEPIRINLNEPIKVKLTDWGKEIYYHQYDRINQIAGREICKPMFPKENENGYTEFQLWCFIQLYGEYIGMAMPNVIEPLEIVYER